MKEDVLVNDDYFYSIRGVNGIVVVHIQREIVHVQDKKKIVILAIKVVIILVQIVSFV